APSSIFQASPTPSSKYLFQASKLVPSNRTFHSPSVTDAAGGATSSVFAMESLFSLSVLSLQPTTITAIKAVYTKFFIFFNLIIMYGFIVLIFSLIRFYLYCPPQNRQRFFRWPL